MTTANFLVLMIAPAGALVIAGMIFWMTSSFAPRHHRGPAE